MLAAQEFGGGWVVVGILAALAVAVLVMLVLAFALLAAVSGQRSRAEDRHDDDAWDRR